MYYEKNEAAAMFVKKRDVAVIKRTCWEGHYLYHPKSIFNLEGSIGALVEPESEIVSMLNSLARVWVFVDDFKDWQSHNYQHTSGKTVQLDHNHSNVCHIFFDDNFRILGIDSIVHSLNKDGGSYNGGCYNLPSVSNNLHLEVCQGPRDETKAFSVSL